MTFIAKTFKWLLISIILIPVILICIFFLERLLGYYPGGISGQVASIAAQRKDVSLCKKIIEPPWIGLFGPTAADHRLNCVVDYARITKDPSACELLMPSDYAWDCLGAAMEFSPCVFLADQQKTVKGQGIETTYDECTSGPESTRNHVCCAMARIAFDGKDKASCDQFSGSERLSDQCHYITAEKNLSVAACSVISSENIKKGCEVAVRALSNKGRKGQ